MLPDTHAHLNAPEFEEDIDGVLRHASEVGVDRILVVGYDAPSSQRAVALARQHDHVFAAVGLHPSEAERFREEREPLRRMLRSEKVVAVGEIGLDFYRNLAGREAQLEAFRTQLHWAEEMNLPVSVHNREADEDTLRALQDFQGAAVLHCFSSSVDVATAAEQMGCYLSFAGNVTFKNASSLREVATAVPESRLLVETDSPYLAPQPRRGRRNEPANVVAVAETLAEVRQVPFLSTCETVSANADRVFGWRAT